MKIQLRQLYSGCLLNRVNGYHWFLCNFCTIATMAHKTISLPTIKCKVQILCSDFLENNEYTFVYTLFQGLLLCQWCEVQISFHSVEKCILCNFLNVTVVYWKLITVTCWTCEQLQNNSSNSAGGPVSTDLNNSKTL